MNRKYYCKNHQGNTSHYDQKNCTMCQLKAEVKQLREHNESVAVCAKHVHEVTRGECLVCECEAAEARLDKIEAGYREAIEDIEGWASYANEYFQEKHDLAGCVDRHKALLRGDAPTNPPEISSKLVDELRALAKKVNDKILFADGVEADLALEGNTTTLDIFAAGRESAIEDLRDELDALIERME